MIESTRSRSAATPLLFAGIRIPLMLISAALTLGVFALIGAPVTFPTSPLISALYLTPVNITCLLLLRRVLHREGGRVRDLLGFDRTRLGRDILWGLLWMAVLYLPFVWTVMGVMFLLYGGDAFERFETVFVPSPAATPALPFAAALVLAIAVVATFAPINAPTEELVYRGYAQGRLQQVWPAWLAIVVPSLGFGVQHLFFAPTPAAMLVFGAAFFVWGIGSGIIYRRQRRLMPLIVSHFIVNLFTSAPAVAVPFLALP